MPIYTKTTFVCPEELIPDTSSGVPQNAVLADHLFYAVSAGHTTLVVEKVLGPLVDNKREFSIVREWYDATQAQTWAELSTASIPGDVGFISCTVLTE